MRFEGVYTAMVTPFTKDREVDESALRDLVDFQIAEGITGLVPMGTTGESPTLDTDEHIRVIEVVVELEVVTHVVHVPVESHILSPYNSRGH